MLYDEPPASAQQDENTGTFVVVFGSILYDVVNKRDVFDLLEQAVVTQQGVVINYPVEEIQLTLVD